MTLITWKCSGERKITMAQLPDENWSSVTWEGSRREQLQRAQRLAIRERLQAAEELSVLLRHFQQLRSAGKFRYEGRHSEDELQAPE